mmetsp:Transcript_21839/g.40928  ORF Transcript_21839/g.40928 Transcript_21839/m.40928 type:complete len:202 (+) Transcript_21839:342-947(+)
MAGPFKRHLNQLKCTRSTSSTVARDPRSPSTRQSKACRFNRGDIENAGATPWRPSLHVTRGTSSSRNTIKSCAVVSTLTNILMCRKLSQILAQIWVSAGRHYRMKIANHIWNLQKQISSATKRSSKSTSKPTVAQAQLPPLCKLVQRQTRTRTQNPGLCAIIGRATVMQMTTATTLERRRSASLKNQGLTLTPTTKPTRSR